MARDGWVKVWRKMIDSPLWLDEPFTRGQAWVDLILMAERKDSDNPGAVCCSELYLAKRWRWSRGKVRRFLEWLKNAGMVIKHKNGHRKGQASGKLLTIAKYSSYQKDRKQNGQSDGHKNEQENGHIEEDDEKTARHADAGDAEDRRLPAVLRDKFASVEEYEEWRRTNS